MEKNELKKLTHRYWDEQWVTERYITQLLPEEVRYLKQNSRIHVTTAEILVQLVGFSWEPLLISICAYKPQKLVLVLNRFYNELEGKARGDRFKEYIKTLKDQNLIDKVSEILPTPWETVGDKPEEVFKFLKKYLLPHLNEGKRVVIDITGAKKSMVSGAYLFASYTNCSVSYLDYDAYSEKYGKPYGYTCKINELKSPMELFKLREWDKVEQLYGQYAFRGALEMIKEIKESTQSFMEADEHKAIDFLTEYLEFYEKWDEGDYRGAWYKYQQLNKNTTSIACPVAVEMLGKIWPDKDNLKIDINSIEGLDDIENSLYLKDAELLTYTYDEIGKIKRIVNYNEDYRSALLRAAGLSDFLFKARVIRLWINDQFTVEINNKISGVRKDLQKEKELLSDVEQKLLTFAGVPHMIKSLRWSSSKKDKETDVLNLYGLKVQGEVIAHRSSDNAPKFEKFWTNINSGTLNLPDDIFKLRDKAIHFCLSVSKEIAEVAVKFAEENLREFRENWIQNETINGKYEAMNWNDLCDACGIKFLPKIRRKLNE